VVERWIPLVAAAVGLLGGMGGAFIGGWVANEGQQQRFEAEQVAQTRDLRIETYSEFLKACGEVQLEGTRANIAKVNAAEARVSLVTSSTEVREAASEFRKVALADNVPESAFTDARDRFVEAALPEITVGA
jgi:riboflavin synthase alpha subunit